MNERDKRIEELSELLRANVESIKAARDPLDFMHEHYRILRELDALWGPHPK